MNIRKVLTHNVQALPGAVFLIVVNRLGLGENEIECPPVGLKTGEELIVRRLGNGHVQLLIREWI